MNPTFDDRDAEILKTRIADRHANNGAPQVGDWVSFADATMRRIAYIWPDSFQTAEGGSYYLGQGYTSYSGSLFGSLPLESLTWTNRKQDGPAWFFHHDHAQAHNGVDVVAPFRVWECLLPANR